MEDRKEIKYEPPKLINLSRKKEYSKGACALGSGDSTVCATGNTAGSMCSVGNSAALGCATGNSN